MVDFNPSGMVMPKNENPLQKYFRQVKIYLSLPSKGNFYPQGALDLPESGEIPIYAMTAKDELLMKTPDALLNGQATVDVIKSCAPNIKDPWQMPSIDLDAILIAIRVATYGDTLDITTKIPVIGDEKEYQLNLNELLAQLSTAEFNNTIEIDNMIVKIKPMSYKEFTSNSLKTLEEQRVFRLINDETIPEEEKLAKFNESFKKLTNLTVDMMSNSVYLISVDGNDVSNSQHIQEFLDNSDKSFYSSIMSHLEEQRNKFQIKPLQVETTEEEREKGAPLTFEVPITFDQSNFFA